MSRSRRPGASTKRMIAAYRHLRLGRPAWIRLTSPDQFALSAGRPGRPHRTPHPRPDPEEASHRHPGLLRPPRHEQRTKRGDERAAGTPPRLRARVPQPHPLHRPKSARDRRIPATTTPSFGRADKPAAEARRCPKRHSWAETTTNGSRRRPINLRRINRHDRQQQANQDPRSTPRQNRALSRCHRVCLLLETLTNVM